MTTRNMRASKRWMMAAAAVAVGASALVASSASAAPDFPEQDTFDPGSVRVGGPDRFGTAATISEFVRENTWDECVDGVTVVNGDNFPDALAAASLMNPILLTEQDVLPEATLAELAELVALNEDCYFKGPIFAEDTSTADHESLPLEITVVGGDAVVSDEVFADLLEFGPVRRLAGPTRYETALEVAMESSFFGMEENGYYCGDWEFPGVILTTGQNFPDALSAGVLAGQHCGTPILLNDGPAVRDDVSMYLDDAGITYVFIIGGDAAVPQSVEDELEAGGYEVIRLAGPTRYDTAVQVAAFLATGGGGVHPPFPEFLQSLILADGTDFPDALAASYAAQTFSSPILLVQPCSIPLATAGWHVFNRDFIESIGVVGGTAAVCDEVLDNAVAAASAVAPELVSATVEVTDVTRREIIFELDGPNYSELRFRATDQSDSEAYGALANRFDVNFVVAPGAGSVTRSGFDITVTTPLPTTAQALATLWNTSAVGGPLGQVTVLEDGGLVTGLDSAYETVEGTTEYEIVSTYNRPVLLPDGTKTVYDATGLAGMQVTDLGAGALVDPAVPAPPSVGFPGSTVVEYVVETDCDDEFSNAWVNCIPEPLNELRVAGPVAANNFPLVTSFGEQTVILTAPAAPPAP